MRKFIAATCAVAFTLSSGLYAQDPVPPFPEPPFPQPGEPVPVPLPEPEPEPEPQPEPEKCGIPDWLKQRPHLGREIQKRADRDRDGKLSKAERREAARLIIEAHKKYMRAVQEARRKAHEEERKRVEAMNERLRKCRKS